jgi:hypothetical protein
LMYSVYYIDFETGDHARMALFGFFSIGPFRLL